MTENKPESSQPGGGVAEKGKPKPKSSIAFPYYSLSKSIEVAKTIHERAGGRCGRAQLASLLKYSGVKNGGFLTRVSAAKLFGLIEEFGDSIGLTDRAKKILAPVRPVDAAQAKLDAFMAVELYRRAYEDFEGHTLPTEDGMKNLFLNQYKIVPLQVNVALRNLMDSADTAGLFAVAGNRSKMIKPLLGNGAGEVEPPPSPPSPPPSEFDTGGGAGEKRRKQVGGTEFDGVHPALAGLMQNLPPLGEKLGPKRRSALVEAFKSTINFLYPEDEE